MVESIVTIVFFVAGLQDGLALLETPAADLVRAGDAAVLYRVETTATGERWQEMARSRVVMSGEGPAVVWSPPPTAQFEADVDAEPDVTDVRVAVAVPADRAAQAPSLPAGAALRALSDAELPAAVAGLIPADERVEVAVLGVLQQRWTGREAERDARAADAASPAAPPAGVQPSPPKVQLGADDLVPVEVTIAPADGRLPSPRSGEPTDPPPRLSANRLRGDLAPVGPPLDLRDSVERKEPPSIGITARIRAWAAARADGRADDVLAFYADGFVPEGGVERTEWAEAVRAELEGRSAATVALGDLDAGFLGGIERARARFTETLTVAGQAQPPRRLELILVWERGEWHILEESVLDTDS